MLKKLFVALAVAAPMAIGFAGTDAAEAKTSVNIYLGIPHYSYQVGPDYVFRKGHGWYRADRKFNRLSCGQAQRLVRNRGFRNVDARDCSGRTYVFRATRNGNRILVYVNSKTGAVWRG